MTGRVTTLLFFLPLCAAAPCDIFAACVKDVGVYQEFDRETAATLAPFSFNCSGGTPCVAAHSMVRALFSNYSGPLYQLRRQADNATFNVPVFAAGGFANASAQDAFCASPPAVQMPRMPPIGYTVNIIPLTEPTLSFRHCYSQGFVTPTDSNPDHQFKLVPSLNGDAGAISFQSINYPTSYIAPVTTAEPGRLGIVEGPPAADASWTITTVGNGVSITLRSRGLSMSVGSNLTGICASSYAPPSASVYLEETSVASLWVLNNAGVSFVAKVRAM